MSYVKIKKIEKNSEKFDLGENLRLGFLFFKRFD